MNEDKALELFRKAEETYASDEIQFDPDAIEKISESEGGCWVQAWVWVSSEEDT